MAVARLTKVRLLAMREERTAILELLQRLEIINLTDLPANAPPAEDLAPLERLLSELKAAIVFLDGIEPKKKSFVEAFLPNKERVAAAEFSAACRGEDCPALIKDCGAIEERLSSMKALKADLLHLHDQLAPWKKLSVPLDTLNESGRVAYLTGKIKINNLGLRSPAAELIVVDRTPKEAYVIVVHLKEAAKPVLEELSKIGFIPLPLSASPNPPAAELARISALLKEIKAEHRQLITKAAGFRPHLSQLKYHYDFLLNQKNTAELAAKLAATRYTFMIEGWLKTDQLPRLKARLDKLTADYALAEVAAGEEEEPPVILTNPAILKPFELITKTYSLPRYGDLDPTAALAFFFIFYFGICLGDVGYGLTLTLISIYFLRRYQLPEGGKNLFQLLGLGGVVAAVSGVLTGSYFGFQPGLFSPLLSSWQIIDPVKNPLVMLAFALCLGVIQILFGIILKFSAKVRSGKYLAAVIDEGFWFFFLSSLVFYLVTQATAAGWCAIAGAVLLVLTQGRHKRSIIEKFFSGLLSLYKVSGYLGDTLSYSRLLALGLSTTVIAAVINILSDMVRGGVPVIGVGLMVVLLFFGHLFNLVIGVLGAFVHSMRLQMVEFFSKFYEGGGRAFRPYSRSAEYTIIELGGN